MSGRYVSLQQAAELLGLHDRVLAVLVLQACPHQCGARIP